MHTYHLSKIPCTPKFILCDKHSLQPMTIHFTYSIRVDKSVSPNRVEEGDGEVFSELWLVVIQDGEREGL